MEVKFSMPISSMRKTLDNEVYKKIVESHFVSNGIISDTLRFKELEIKSSRVQFVFERVKKVGVLHIEWANVHDYVVKYFGSHEPRKKYFNLAAALRKIKTVEFVNGERNITLAWNYLTDSVAKFTSGDMELLNQPYFDSISLNAFFREIEHKNITKEQFKVAYNEVFGGR